MDLNLRHVRAFVSVAQLKSFTRAADLLHVSQPALTVQIRKLEDALKNRLLDRNSRSVELTRTGRELLPLLKRTLQDVDLIVADAHAQSVGNLGTVRIASLPSFAASALPEAIIACRKRNPGLGFVVRDAVASEVMRLVRSEEVDLGITGGAVTDHEFETLHEMRDRMCLVYPAAHPIAKRRSIKIKDIIDLPLVLTDPATSVRALIDAAFHALGPRAAHGVRSDVHDDRSGHGACRSGSDDPAGVSTRDTGGTRPEKPADRRSGVRAHRFHLSKEEPHFASCCNGISAHVHCCGERVVGRAASRRRPSCGSPGLSRRSIVNVVWQFEFKTGVGGVRRTPLEADTRCPNQPTYAYRER